MLLLLLLVGSPQKIHEIHQSPQKVHEIHKNPPDFHEESQFQWRPLQNLMKGIQLDIFSESFCQQLLFGHQASQLTILNVS